MPMPVDRTGWVADSGSRRCLRNVGTSKSDSIASSAKFQQVSHLTSSRASGRGLARKKSNIRGSRSPNTS
jgi:hypothetical protein